jgi:hypothetical protein
VHGVWGGVRLDAPPGPLMPRGVDFPPPHHPTLRDWPSPSYTAVSR